MKTVTAETMAADVKVAIDENTTATDFGEDTDTLEMEDIIKAKIPDGINAVRMVAPLAMLELTRLTPSVTWTDTEKGIGRIDLPSDYMRLALFKMSDWLYGVTTAISPTDDSYPQQFSDYSGVRGNPSRPVVAVTANDGSNLSVTSTNKGGGALEFFSCGSTSATATLLYAPRIVATATQYAVEEGLYRAMVLKTASLVAGSYGSSDMMQLLETMSKEQLG